MLRGRAHAAGTAMRRPAAVSGVRWVRDVGAALCLVRSGCPVLWLRGGAVLRGRAHAAGTAMRRPAAVSGVRWVRDVGAATSGRWAWFGGRSECCDNGIADEVRDRLAALAVRFYRPVFGGRHIDEDAFRAPLGLRQRRAGRLAYP